MSYLLDGVLRRPTRPGATTSTSSSSAPPSRSSSPRSTRSSSWTATGSRCAKTSDGPFQRGRVYSGGNIKAFQDARARASGDRVLFVGDHIYGDMLRRRKSSNWRTAMVLQELEHEITMYDRLRPELARLDRLDAELIHLDSELNERQAAMRALQKLAARRHGGDGVERRPSAP